MIGKLFIILIRIYQYTLAAVLGGQCRFHPSCSEYSIEAIRIHGAWRGTRLALKRIFKCHPWHPGGVDRVPEAGTKGELL